MFSQAELNQVAIKGHVADPSAIQLVAAVKNNQQRIRNFLESVQTRVGSGHLILKILSSIGYAAEPEYLDIEWACRRKLSDIGNALRLISPGNFGQVYNGAFIEGQDEIISLVARPVDPDLPFRDYTPAVYLYHEYTNLNWQFGDNRPRGVAIIEINLVALLWQYVLAEQHYRKSTEQMTSVVYAQRHVITRMLPSYMDIAFLNVHRAVAFNKEMEDDLPMRVVNVPPLHDLTVRHARNIHKSLLAGTPHPGTVLAHVPQFFENPLDPSTAVDRVQHRYSGSTTQASWHQNIINWYWALYVLQYDNPSMDKFKSNLNIDIARFEDSKVLQRQTKSVQTYLQLNLIKPLYAALEN
ncbi:hypothetical protein G173_gp203 [Erwinia phage phiEaH2]|uniref:Uncharacterized protein n=1 Tax=Erwinia phage phiEaH2 TaxID=1029988 RepID=J7KHN1_9CAUD|nr:hypothetical protein G173_gp203 [Erwinia phage phiEaH2]AFQ96748.1 hypothetical protein [Erwinia phage phiEaH2]